VDAKRPSAVDMLDKMTCIVHAASSLLVQVAACMRQVVTVAGWLVLLVSTISLLADPHVSPTHLIPSGAGAFAVLQNLIKERGHPRTDRSDKSGVAPPEGCQMCMGTRSRDDSVSQR
jgi:hypothetical protein